MTQWLAESRKIFPVIFVIFVSSLMAAAPEELPLKLTFTEASPSHKEAAAEYRAISASNGAKIVEALQRHTRLRFEESKIEVTVVEEPSQSGYGSQPMRLRASYPAETKKGTLIHELGHRLQNRFFSKEDEDHPYLFLYLYDVWTALYGSEFADRQVIVESRRKGYYDYEKAWQDALSLTAEERLAKWQEFLESREK